jgi:hypothetical protein
VSEARRQLAGGNMREATANFNRAKTKFTADKDGGRRRAKTRKRI